MSEMMKRRTFLKTAGAVVAAVALAACDGDAPAASTPATKPTPSGKTEVDLDGITVKTSVVFTTRRVRFGDMKETPVWGVTWDIVPSEDVTFSKDNFSMRTGEEELNYLGIWNREATLANGNEYTVTETLDVKAAKGQVQVSAYFKVTEEQYLNGGTFNTTIEYKGRKFTFTNCRVPGIKPAAN